MNCLCLTSMAIHGSVETLGPNLFQGCCRLLKIRVVGKGQNFRMVKKFLFNREMVRFIWCSKGKSGSCEIPLTVKTIDSSAFRSCKELITVSIPNSVTAIPSDVFSFCSGIKAATIPRSVTSIGVCTFENCSGLVTISLPKCFEYQKAFPKGVVINKY